VGELMGLVENRSKLSGNSIIELMIGLIIH